MARRAAILAGGRSTRLGRPKAAAELGGQPLLGYPLAAARRAGLEAVVVAKAESELPELEAPVLVEPPLPHHPLCGVVAALHALESPLVALACDMPFVTAELLAWLASLPEPLVLAETRQGVQPLLGRYDPTLAGALEQGLREQAPMRELVASLDPRLIGPEELSRFGDPERLIFNVNRPEDLARAERLLSPPARP